MQSAGTMRSERNNTVKFVRKESWNVRNSSTTQQKHSNSISLSIEPTVQVATTSVPVQYRSHLSTHTDHHVANRPLGAGPSILNLPDHVHSVDDLSKDDVFVVEEGGRSGGDEELRAIAVGAGVLRYLCQVSCGDAREATEG